MTSPAKLNDKEYTKLLDDADFSAASYKEIATALMENGVKETYHALVNEEDILTLFKIITIHKFAYFLCLNNSTFQFNNYKDIQIDKENEKQISFQFYTRFIHSISTQYM